MSYYEYHKKEIISITEERYETTKNPAFFHWRGQWKFHNFPKGFNANNYCRLSGNIYNYSSISIPTKDGIEIHFHTQNFNFVDMEKAVKKLFEVKPHTKKYNSKKMQLMYDCTYI